MLAAALQHEIVILLYLYGLVMELNSLSMNVD